MVSFNTCSNHNLVQLRNQKLLSCNGQTKEASKIQLLRDGYFDHCRIVKRHRDVQDRLAFYRS